MSRELKECPFCGSSDICTDRHLSRMDSTFYPTCTNCGTVGKYGTTKEEAIKAWNTRKDTRVEEALKEIGEVRSMATMEDDIEHGTAYFKASEIIEFMDKIKSILQGDNDNGK